MWAALTEPESLGRWLAAVVDVELVPGGAFELALPGDGAIAASVREIVPPRLLELAWSHAREAPSLVRFELAADGDETVLVLDHRQIDERYGMRYISRWTRALDRLHVGEER